MYCIIYCKKENHSITTYYYLLKQKTEMRDAINA